MCKECKDYRSKNSALELVTKVTKKSKSNLHQGSSKDITEAITERALKTKDPENLKLVACFALASSRLMDAHKETTIVEGKYKGFPQRYPRDRKQERSCDYIERPKRNPNYQ